MAKAKHSKKPGPKIASEATVNDWNAKRKAEMESKAKAFTNKSDAIWGNVVRKGTLTARATVIDVYGFEPLGALIDLARTAMELAHDSSAIGGVADSRDSRPAFMSVAATCLKAVADFTYPKMSAQKLTIEDARTQKNLDIKRAHEVISNDPFAADKAKGIIDQGRSRDSYEVAKIATDQTASPVSASAPLPVGKGNQ